MKVHSDAHEAARQSLAVNDSTTYPSIVSAQHIRKVLDEIVREYEDLHRLYAATCSAYVREHERAQAPCFAEKNDGVLYVCRCAKCRAPATVS